MGKIQGYTKARQISLLNRVEKKAADIRKLLEFQRFRQEHAPDIEVAKKIRKLEYEAIELDRRAARLKGLIAA